MVDEAHSKIHNSIIKNNYCKHWVHHKHAHTWRWHRFGFVHFISGNMCIYSPAERYMKRLNPLSILSVKYAARKQLACLTVSCLTVLLSTAGDSIWRVKEWSWCTQKSFFFFYLFHDSVEDCLESRSTSIVSRREIGASYERSKVRGQPNTHGPSSTSTCCLQTWATKSH